ncbi:GNAT family N-acetyltransferase [Aminobacter sp. HY435]|uniref:GNAT family N-acetyltransferase n=1 Tax=Aminobacter sp. HY435 TaxID=2970917 RepID=UPI0022B96C6A|nr:GNAT family N-acetyltransferase [Aminobacter sp. HY435]
MQIDVVESIEDLQRLKEDWDAVYAADPEAHLFLGWTWISNWVRKVGHPWVVLAAKADPSGSYVGFLPLQLRAELDEASGFFNSLRMGGSYFAVYTGLLCQPEHEGQAIPAFAEQMKALHWKQVHLDDIFMSARRRQLLLEPFGADDYVVEKIIRRPHITASGDNINHDVYIYVDLPGDWEVYLNSQLGPKARYHARNRLRKVDAGDEFRITIADASTIERDLSTLFRFWMGRWEPKNPGYARGILNNCRAMLPACFRDGMLFVPVFWQGDVPVGAHLNFLDRDKRTLINLLGGRDMTASKVPVGFSLHVFTMRWAIENGFTSYDLGTGDFGYKYDFGSKERLIEGVRISTRSGRNLGVQLDRRTLPAILSWSQRLLDDGKLDLAAVGCRQILDADATNAEAAQMLEKIDSAESRRLASAVQLHREGKLVDAARIYTAILADNPRQFDANYMFGVACLQRNEFQAATVYLGRAVETRPEHASAHNNLGNAMRALNRFEDATAAYRSAIASNPNFAEAFNNMGLALRELGKSDEAVEWFDKALHIKPDFEKATRNRENLLRELGRA